MIPLRADLLARAAGCTAERAAAFAPHLDVACGYYGINRSVARLSAFLAQVGHESAGFAASVESLNYSVDALLRTFGRHRISEADARAMGRADGRPADPVAIANAVYGGEWGQRELGNTQPGDGWRYRGRGPMQLTGRANYARLTQRLRARLGPGVPDFEADPDALQRPEWGAWCAADFWDMRGLNALADRDDFLSITRKINGGINGLDDRERRWELARRVLAEARPEPAPVEERSTPAAAAIPDTPPPPAAPAQEQTMPAPALLTALASTAINLFTPVAADKLRKEFGRHTDPAVAEQLTTGVIEAVKTATGQADPIQAVAAVQADPAALQRAEAGALQVLDRLLPLLERINAMEQGNIRAAREFNADEPLFIDTPWIRMKFVHLLSLVFVCFAGWFVLEHWGALTSELKGAVITLMVIAGWNGVRDYWMGSSSGSAEKTAMLSRAEAGQRRAGG